MFTGCVANGLLTTGDNLVTVLPMDLFGWKTEDNTLQVEWGPPENVKKQEIQLPS